MSDCHRRIEYFLRVLIAVDERLAGGALTPAQRADLEAALRYFATAAPKHTADEEESLFPRLRETRDAATARAFEVLARLERDHDEAEQHHRAVDTLGPELACRRQPRSGGGRCASRADRDALTLTSRAEADVGGSLYPVSI